MTDFKIDQIFVFVFFFLCYSYKNSSIKKWEGLAWANSADLFTTISLAYLPQSLTTADWWKKQLGKLRKLFLTGFKLKWNKAAGLSAAPCLSLSLPICISLSLSLFLSGHGSFYSLPWWLWWVAGLATSQLPTWPWACISIESSLSRTLSPSLFFSSLLRLERICTMATPLQTGRFQPRRRLNAMWMG